MRSIILNIKALVFLGLGGLLLSSTSCETQNSDNQINVCSITYDYNTTSWVHDVETSILSETDGFTSIFTGINMYEINDFSMIPTSGEALQYVFIIKKVILGQPYNEYRFYDCSGDLLRTEFDKNEPVDYSGLSFIKVVK